jgi:hypothetical protein
MTRRKVALAQGAYYVVTGLWPIVSLPSFERVTGPKTDDWLVRTVGLLAAAIGGVLAWRGASRRSRPDPALGISSALAFATTDVVHVARGRISRIYLADAAAELALAVAWLVAGRD